MTTSQNTTNIVFFFFNDTATTEIYTLSLHDALPIRPPPERHHVQVHGGGVTPGAGIDRKSTRLNSSDVKISYAVSCLKKKKIAVKANQRQKKEAFIIFHDLASIGV